MVRWVRLPQQSLNNFSAQVYIWVTLFIMKLVGFICLIAYQLLMSYLILKFSSYVNIIITIHILHVWTI